MYQVKKRNGDLEMFELSKIKSAITRTFEACGRNYQDSIVETLAIKSVANAEKKIKDDVLSVEDIQDSVESILMGYGYEDVSKAYILYRKQHEKARNAKNSVLDYKKTMDGYLKASDWRVKENSSISYSLGGLILGNSGAMTANYWLSEIYDDDIAKAHNNCDLHIHDLSMLSGYCAGWSLKTLIKEGFNGVAKKTSSGPAKHLSTLCNQMTNFLGCLQNEWSGAQAFNSVDTLLAPFVKAENLSYKEVKQCIQSLIFNLNTSSRWGCVPDDTEVLTVDGFKKYNELKVGDLIYTWHEGTLEINDVKNVLIKEYSGKLQSYTGRGYDQTVTPEHHVLCKKFNKDEYVLKDSKDIFDVKTPYSLPVKFKSSALDSSDLTDAQIQLAAIVYADGTLDFRKGSIHKVKIFKSAKRFGNDLIKMCADELGLEYSVKSCKRGFSECLNTYTFYGNSARYIAELVGSKTKVHERFLNMSSDQSNLFLDTWMKFDGDTGRYMIQYDNDDIADALQHIALRSGCCTYLVSYDKKTNKKPTNYVSIRRVDTVCPTERTETDYNGIVWCPSVENGTAVFRRNGKVFISGQSQPVFSNFTFDWTVPDDLAELNCIVGGEELDFKYKDCKREMDMINKAFLEVMVEGDADGKGFSYPIPTYSITKDFDWDEEVKNNQLLFEMTAKYGIPYFSNYINSDMSPQDVRSMCCRLRLSLRELRKKNGGFFGSGDNTGSIGVVTINMPRLAYLSSNKEDFYKRLTHLMDIAARSLKIKRTVIEQFFESGLYPYTKRYLKSLDDHFSTIGLIGMNECCLNAKWIDGDISGNQGYAFTKEVIDYMREKLADYQEQYGNLYNLEATPAEGVTRRFANHDKKDFPDIITAGDKTDGSPYYTNSSHLPVGYTDDIFEALDHQDDLQTKYTSGTVFHAFLGEKLPNWQSAMMLTRKIAENYKLPYFTFSPTYSICPEHGYIKGEEWTCPHCGKPTEVYSRVTGYYRAVQNFNDGKAHEFRDRKEYKFDSNTLNTPTESECESCKTDFTELPTTDFEKESSVGDAVRSILADARKPMLFTTATCPNCKMAKKFIADAKFDCDILLAEDNQELVKLYEITSAPTLVVFDNGSPVKIQNVSNIRKFLDELK